MKTLVNLAVAAVIATAATGAQAITLNAGYNDALIATINTGNNPFGSVTADAAGNRYVTGNNSVFKVSAAGAVSTIATTGYTALSIDVIGSTLYFGGQSSPLFSTPLSGGGVTTLTPPSGISTMQGLAASADGAYLYAVGDGSRFERYDIANGAWNTLPSLPGGGSMLSSPVVTATGRLLFADYYADQIWSYDPAGNSYSVFATGLNRVNGLAVDPISNDVFAMLENVGQIIRLSADGTTRSTFASAVPYDSGYYPSALSFSADGSELYYLAGLGNDHTQLRAITGFPAAAVPEPAMLGLFGLAAFGLAVSRRRKA